MTDFVYPLGRGSTWANNELRFSIRSLEKYVPNLGQIAIATWDPLPPWLDKKAVIHLKISDMYGHNRTLNTLRKALFAAADKRLSPDIVWMNDDLILLQQADSFPHCVKGVLGESHSKKTGDYYTACQHTIAYLAKHGITPARNFATHRPLPLNRARFTELLTPVAAMMRPFLWGSVYCNMAKVEGVPSSDVKVHTPEQFLSNVDKLSCVSLGDRVPKDSRVREWLHQRFPEPSRFEHTQAMARTA